MIAITAVSTSFGVAATHVLETLGSALLGLFRDICVVDRGFQTGCDASLVLAFTNVNGLSPQKYNCEVANLPDAIVVNIERFVW